MFEGFLGFHARGNKEVDFEDVEMNWQDYLGDMG